MSEARTGKRFPLQLPIMIYSQQSSRKAKGTTSNVSASGVYIWSERAFAVGSPIRFEMTLPATVAGTERDVQIECSGRVVRADSTGAAKKGRGLACVIDRYKFIRGQQAGRGQC